MLKKIIATLSVLSICSVASAITWNFVGGPGGSAPAYNIMDTSGTHMLTATGNNDVTWGAHGLGIKGGRNKQIDNKGRNDRLFLNLLMPFFVKEFEIRSQDGNDRVRWKLDSGTWTNVGVVGNNSPISINQVGQVVKFTTGGNDNIKQGFRVSKLIAYKGAGNRVPDNGTTLGLLGLALIGLFFARNRVRK